MAGSPGNTAASGAAVLRDHHSVCRAGCSAGQSHWRLSQAPQASGVPAVSPAHGSRVRRQNSASGDRQLWHSPTRRGQGMAEEAPSFRHPLRAHQLQLAQLIERWFAELTNKRIRRDSFRSVEDLVAAIEEFLAVWNEKPKPFVWT